MQSLHAVLCTNFLEHLPGYLPELCLQLPQERMQEGSGYVDMPNTELSLTATSDTPSAESSRDQYQFY